MRNIILLFLVAVTLSACSDEIEVTPVAQELRIVQDKQGEIVHVKHERLDLFLDTNSKDQLSGKDLVDVLAQLHKGAESNAREVAIAKKMLMDQTRLFDGLDPYKAEDEKRIEAIVKKLIQQAYTQNNSNKTVSKRTITQETSK